MFKLRYFYKIGWDSYEESEFTELWHECMFTKAALKKKIYASTVKVLENLVKNESNLKDEDYIFSPINERGVRYERLHSLVIEELIKNHGFHPIEYTETWSTFGWVSVCDKKDWKGQRVKENDEMYNAIPKSLLIKLRKIQKLGRNKRMKITLEWKKNKKNVNLKTCKNLPKRER